MKPELARLEIQQQKQLPTLTPSVERILSACEDPAVSQTALAEVLTEAPTITARLLGLANSAFFGQSNGVHSLPHAISVLGTVTVRSISVGLALSGAFDTRHCPGFSAARYWMSAEMTALAAQYLTPQVVAGVRPPADSVYLAGLLHNIGLLVLVHLHPAEMDRAFATYAADRSQSLGQHIVAVLGVDHYQAGVWLGSKWHFPRDLLLVMEHHYNPAYRGDHWPLVLLEGLAARWANQVIDGTENLGDETETLSLLGLATDTPTHFSASMQMHLGPVRAFADSFAAERA